MTATETKSTQQGPALKREIGMIGLLFTGVGSIIGSGWLFGALNASQQAGPAAIFSWMIATVMILLIGLVYAELGTMFPVSGAVVRVPHLSFGSFASYSMGWINWVAAATVAPIEVEGALQYATKYAPFTTLHMVSGEPVHTLTALGYVLAVVLMAVFVVVNFFGIRWFARLNTVLVWWKIAIVLLVIVAFLVTAFHGANFTSHGFRPQGWHAVFTAISTAGITFSFLGFRQGIELAGETDNPKRNVPIAVVGSVLITGVIYVLLQVAFIGSVRPSDLADGWGNLDFANDFGPLAAIASIIGLGWLAVLLYIDAVVSPGDTGLIYTTVTARISYAMGKNRNAPEGLTKTTNRGAPIVSLIVSFIVGLIIFLPFPSWQQLVGFITTATVLSFGSGPLVLAAMRRQIPDHKRTFKLPGGDVIPFLAFFSANMIVYWGGWTTNWKLFVAILLGYVLFAIFQAIGGDRTPPLDIKAGATWVLPWLGALALASYLGDYPEPSEHAGNTGLIGFGWGFVVIFLISVAIYVLALRFALPTARVEEHIEQTTAEAAQEQAELGAAPA
ncbi:MAG: APC family permease [Propionibacteriaceae bacterium]